MNNLNILCPQCNHSMTIESIYLDNYIYYVCKDCIFIISKINVSILNNIPSCEEYKFVFEYKNSYFSLRTVTDDYQNTTTNLFKKYSDPPLITVPFVPLDLNNTKISFNNLINRLFNLITFA